MTDIVKGMTIAGWHKGNPVLKNHLQCFPETLAEEEAKMRAALLWLADNVSDEMVMQFEDKVLLSRNEWGSHAVRASIAAAIRAAAGGGKCQSGTPTPVAEICEWEQRYEDGLFKWNTRCNNSVWSRQAHDEDRGTCGFCNRRIRFTEKKR